VFLGYFCIVISDGQPSYFITLILHNIFPQHGGGNTEHRQTTSLSPYLLFLIFRIDIRL